MTKVGVAHISGHTFISNLIDRESSILDLGANRGAFSREIMRRWGCQAIHAVEPTPDLADELEKINGLNVYRYAVTSRAEQARFLIDARNSESSRITRDSTDNDVVTVEGITLAALIARFGDLDMVKMDIEGAEIEVLKATPADMLQRVKQLTIEFHDFQASSGVTKDHVRQVMKRMRAFGFRSFVASFWTYGDVLFVNQKFLPLSFVDAALLSLRVRWLPGVRRVIGKSVRRK